MQIPQQTIDEANTDLRKARRALRKATSLEEAKKAAQHVADLKATDAETTPVAYDGKAWPADRESQARIHGLIRNGEAAGEGWTYRARTVGSGIVEVGVNDLQAIAQAYADQVDAAREWLSGRLTAIDGAESIQEVRGLDLTPDL